MGGWEEGARVNLKLKFFFGGGGWGLVAGGLSKCFFFYSE